MSPIKNLGQYAHAPKAKHIPKPKPLEMGALKSVKHLKIKTPPSVYNAE